ncbi:hypothetical protein F2P81_020997 [Scophthalmus maximus]|uniref:Taste receptor type 2 n=1 Tax=Scophthalmus maximus TaxID=52904 RepID=A0A6A4S3P0_SCOMX|nr:hypothetical protein F2P81_020997 [Scophthalmus maximus]
MENHIDLGEHTFMLINGPLFFINLTANIFYACCLVFPPRSGQRLAQPLTTLLGYLVWCSVMYCVALPLMFWALKEGKSYYIFLLSWAIVLYIMHCSMTCYVWLNFFFYIQIVPVRRAPLIWIKRNVKSVIYGALLLEAMFVFYSSAVNIAYIVSHMSSGLTCFNGTCPTYRIPLVFSNTAFDIIFRVHILLCMCFMTVSSVSTAHYLCRHMRNMAQSGSPFNTRRRPGQMRITITGLSQGVLYFLYETYYLLYSLTNSYSQHILLGPWICFTVTTLYISGTTFNLGVGQVIFRQRAVHIWMALKAMCHIGLVTNGGEVHASQLTLGEIATTQTVSVKMS